MTCGSDWPVLTVAATYKQWWQTLHGWTASLSGEERSQMEGGTAQRIYHLDSEAHLDSQTQKKANA